MDIGKLLTILCLTVLIGVGLPAMIFFWARRENTSAMLNTMRRAANTSRDPWKKEKQDLEELSRRVEALKEAAGPDRAVADSENEALADEQTD
jgi:KaiC/GvpD/RAD55 family RecA-like ATPase